MFLAFSNQLAQFFRRIQGKYVRKKDQPMKIYENAIRMRVNAFWKDNLDLMINGRDCYKK